MIFILGLTLNLLAMILADDPCAVLSTPEQTCSMQGSLTDTNGYDCVCLGPANLPKLPPKPSTPFAPEFHIVGAGSNRCADVSGGSQNENGFLIIYDCASKDHRNQVFSARAASNGGYNLVIAHSGKCMSENGLDTVQQTCGGGDNQIWEFSNPLGKGTIKNRRTGKCLDAQGAGTGNSVKLIQWPCHGQGNQLWNVVGL